MNTHLPLAIAVGLCTAAAPAFADHPSHSAGMTTKLSVEQAEHQRHVEQFEARGERSFYLAPVISWSDLDSDYDLEDSIGYGLRVGAYLSERWAVELYLDRAGSEVEPRGVSRKDVSVFSISFDALHTYGNLGSFTPFSLFGIGWSETSNYPGDGEGYTLSAGGGFFYPIANWDAKFRADLRARFVDSDSAFDESGFIDYIVTVGVQFDLDLDPRKKYRGHEYGWPVTQHEVVAIAEPEKLIGVDSDGDLVPDQRDRCENTPVGTKVNPRGCEVDSDSDGVVDSKDGCPDTEIGIVVGRIGCPLYLDIDDDGVLNTDDRCNNTEKNVVVDSTGCDAPVKPVTQLETVELTGVEFRYKSTELTEAAKDSLVPLLSRFDANSRLIAEVAGHTDSKASRAYNQRLSEQRAESVREFLVKSGIPARQLRVKGYGESQPIASNKTEEGKARNRRVELRILSQ